MYDHRRAICLLSFALVLSSPLIADIVDFTGLETATTTVATVPPNAVDNDGFLFGFNQAWMQDHYGSQWTTAWDEAEVRRVLALTRAANGRVLRMWLFEGLGNEGVRWDGTTVRTKPVGIDPVKLQNPERFLELAAAEGVAV